MGIERNSLAFLPHTPADAPVAPLAAVAAVRGQTEAVFERVLGGMCDAMDDLSRSASALSGLASVLAPAELVRLRDLHRWMEGLAVDIAAGVQRSQDSAQALARSMRSGQGHLDDLHRLTRTGLLVSLNARVVSGAMRRGEGALEGLAQDMRMVLADVSGLTGKVAADFVHAQAVLDGACAAVGALQAFASQEVVPAIQEFAVLVDSQASDKTLPQSASVASARLATLKDRVGSAILHLQVGDGLRQRLEHVEAILAQAEDPASPVPPPWLRALAGAQLRAALDDLGRAIQEGRRNLRALARLAIQAPGAGVAASPGRKDSGLFLLMSSAARVAASIDGLARTGQDLAEASERLAAAVSDVGRATPLAVEFEQRMTVLGLNAILLSSRLGAEGRAMTEVAQQLRDVARGIADVVSQLRADAEASEGAVRNLDMKTDNRLAGRLAEAGSSSRQVSALAQAVGGRMEELRSIRSTGDIARLFEAADGRLEAFGAMALALEPVAAALEDDSLDEPALGPEAADALLAIRSSYTMSAERSIHDRLFPPPVSHGSDEPAEEVLFFT